MSTLADWIDLTCAELGLAPGEVDTALVLDLARDVARGVARPAAPVTTYLLGVAVGQGAQAARAAARLTELAAAWDHDVASAE